MTDYYDLGAYSRRITTKSPEAQVWFDRGLNWLYGFNHAEAIKCFGKALEYDAECAMAHWGVAYATGPNYNLPWNRYDPLGKAKALAASYDALQSALAAADWSRVVSVRVCLLVADPSPVNADVATTYRDCADNVQNIADGRLRRRFTSSFALRNRVG